MFVVHNIIVRNYSQAAPLPFQKNRSSIMEFTMVETGWLSILPPLIAIALALITKEVYSSLFIGIMSGMLIYSFHIGGGLVKAVSTTFDMMYSKIADNAYMIIFLALLWAVVMLVSKSGGSQAYGRWAGKRLSSKRSAAFATSLLGILIFIDDGFNCLTVGTVMRPIPTGSAYPGKSWPTS